MAPEAASGATRSLGHRVTAALASDAALYAVLLALVWGVTVGARGLWQDDTLLLRMARASQGKGITGALAAPSKAPLRRLYTLPFLLALQTPQPIWALHLMFGLVWLGQALAAGWIAALLLPGQRLVRFLAICLTLTATSDLLTDNLTALGYNVAALAILLAVGCGLRWLVGGLVFWLPLSCLALAVSIWTLDVGIPAVPFFPLLLWWRGGVQRWRRQALALLAWGVTLAPAISLEWRFLHDPHSYAAVAIQHLGARERIVRTIEHFLLNFAPWRWAFARPLWLGTRAPAVLATWAIGLGACLAAGWFIVRARTVLAADRSRRVEGTMWLVALLAAMALAGNAAYAGLQIAEIHYRTHILSRTWASLALAVTCGWAMSRWPRHAQVMLVVPTVFVGLGVWGGLEAQDRWVGTWRQHRVELWSIVTAAPAIVPGTAIVLRSGPTPGRYLATEADYLAASWLVLLYDDPGIHTLRLAPHRHTECRASADALVCRHEPDGNLGRVERFPYDRLVLMDFDPRAGVYRLVDDLEGDPLLAGTGLHAQAYHPAARILSRPPTPWQRALLLR